MTNTQTMKCHANAHLAFLGSKRKGPASLLNHLNKQVWRFLLATSSKYCFQLLDPENWCFSYTSKLQSASVFRAPTCSSVFKNPWSKACWCHTMNPTQIARMHRFKKPLVLIDCTFIPGILSIPCIHSCLQAHHDCSDLVVWPASAHTGLMLLR